MDKSFNWIYTDKVKEHFINPRNILEDEQNFRDDGKGVVGNLKCGDQMLMAIKVDKEKQNSQSRSCVTGPRSS